MHCRHSLEAHHPLHAPAAPADVKADPPLFRRATGLLLHLVCLLARRLLALVPVLDSEIERIMCDLELGADTCLDCLEKTLWALCLLVLVLVCAEHVVDRREGELLELGGVFLDDRDALLQLGQ